MFLVDGVVAQMLEVLGEGESSVLAHMVKHMRIHPNWAFTLLSSCNFRSCFVKPVDIEQSNVAPKYSILHQIILSGIK